MIPPGPDPAGPADDHAPGSPDLDTEAAAGAPTGEAVEIQQLREQIRRHDYLYYVLDAPEIPDAAYDNALDDMIGLVVPVLKKELED